jgi:hypothetical protein
MANEYCEKCDVGFKFYNGVCRSCLDNFTSDYCVNRDKDEDALKYLIERVNDLNERMDKIAKSIDKCLEAFIDHSIVGSRYVRKHFLINPDKE